MVVVVLIQSYSGRLIFFHKTLTVELQLLWCKFVARQQHSFGEKKMSQKVTYVFFTSNAGPKVMTCVSYTKVLNALAKATCIKKKCLFPIPVVS